MVFHHSNEVPDKEEIWVLGHNNTNADKSFLWCEEIPNITDADVVILDLGALPTTERSQGLGGAELYMGNSYTEKNIYVKLSADRRVKMSAKTMERIDKLRVTVAANLESKITGGGHVIYLLHHNLMSEYMCKAMRILPFNIEMTKVAGTQ